MLGIYYSSTKVEHMAVDDRELRQLLDFIEEQISQNIVDKSDLRIFEDEVEGYIRHNNNIPKPLYSRLRQAISHLEAHFSRDLMELEYKLQDKFRTSDNDLVHINELTQDYTVPRYEIQDSDQIVFLLGAGASFDSGVPLIDGLLDNLVQQARRTQDEEFTQLLIKCQRDEDIDIEDLLTAVYLSEFAVSEPNTLGLLQSFLFSNNNTFSPGEEQLSNPPETDATSISFIQNTIETLFGSIASEMIPKDPNPTHESIREMVKEQENVSIITTNYDYCLDEALLNHVSVNTVVNNIGDGEEESDVDVFKIHGSINWTYCDNCQEMDGVSPEKVKEKFDSETESLDYPVIGLCPTCKGERRPLLVPPTSFKFVQYPPLIDIRKGAKQKLQNADYIVPVGYSFSDADAYIYKLVWGAMRKNDGSKMVVVDPNEDVAEKLSTKFKNQVQDFDTDRIDSIAGSSEEVIPDLVDEFLDQGEEQTEEASS